MTRCPPPGRAGRARSAIVLSLAAALLASCVPAEPRARTAPSRRDILPTHVTLMLLESRDSDFDLAPDTFVVDVVLFNEFESQLPVRPAGSMRFELIGAGDAMLSSWDIPEETLRLAERRTALGLDGYRVSLSMRQAGAEDDVPAQAARLAARFLPAGGGPGASGATPLRLGLSQ